MRIRKFIGRSMKEAVANVKHELGPDAVVISAKEVRRGLFGAPMVEVSAGIEVDALDKKTVAPPTPPPALPKEEPFHRVPLPMNESDIERIVGPLRAEMRHLRALVKHQSEVPSANALKGELAALKNAVQELQKSTSFAQLQSVPMPVEVVANGACLCAESNAHFVAIVGPSGVGKTTTIAKLASRDALIHRNRVGLITMDVYRVGAVEQIRAYADLIGVPLEVVSDPREFAAAARRLQRVDRIYVDTGSRSPGDREPQVALAEALSHVDDIEIQLAIAAGSSQSQVDRIVERFKGVNPDRLIFTKCDEAEDMRELVCAPVRTRIPISYLTTGQRVPEDIEPATHERLVALAQSGIRALAVAA